MGLIKRESDHRKNNGSPRLGFSSGARKASREGWVNVDHRPMHQRRLKAKTQLYVCAGEQLFFVSGEGMWGGIQVRDGTRLLGKFIKGLGKRGALLDAVPRRWCLKKGGRQDSKSGAFPAAIGVNGRIPKEDVVQRGRKGNWQVRMYLAPGWGEKGWGIYPKTG